MELVGDSVAQELGRFGAASGAAAIVDAWPAAVGAEIARNAWPARVMRDGTLVVHTSSATWAFELGHLQGQIRESLGGVAPPKLRFVVGPLPSPATDEEATRRTVVEPSGEDVATAAALASPIADENLRKIVAKAAALSLAIGASDRSLW
jgi:hypothetical protein